MGFSLESLEDFDSATMKNLVPLWVNSTFSPRSAASTRVKSVWRALEIVRGMMGCDLVLIVQQIFVLYKMLVDEN
jgi:hypothetical protein